MAFVAELTVQTTHRQRAHKVGLDAIERCGLSEWCRCRARAYRRVRSMCCRRLRFLPPPHMCFAHCKKEEGGSETGGDICILSAQCALMRRHSGGGRRERGGDYCGLMLQRLTVTCICPSRKCRVKACTTLFAIIPQRSRGRSRGFEGYLRVYDYPRRTTKKE